MVINPTYRRKNNLTQLGFGLIELMVSISVMVLVTSVILVKHDSYNGATLLRSQAYDIALQLREVQLLSISAAQDGSANANAFRNVYGVHFSTTTNDTYFVFKDADSDFYFDYANTNSEKFGKQGTLSSKFVIDTIRLISSSGNTEENELSISFKRPNFDANFYEGSGNAVDPSVSAVEIDVRTKGTTGGGSGNIRTVEITRTGQITVK